MKLLEWFLIFFIFFNIVRAYKLNASNNNKLSKDKIQTNEKDTNFLIKRGEEFYEKSTKVYEGICFVKIHGWLYDLNLMDIDDR